MKRFIIHLVFGLMVSAALTKSSKTTEHSGVDGRRIRILQFDESERTVGNCLDKEKCLEKCPGNLFPNVVWKCMNPRFCVGASVVEEPCQYIFEGFCRRRRLQNLHSLPAGRQMQAEEGFDACEDSTECPGICVQFGRCLESRPLHGQCRVGNLRDEGDRHIACADCDLDTCKAKCYADFRCEGIEYREYDRTCEIHNVLPNLARGKPGAYCYRKLQAQEELEGEVDETQSEACWASGPELVGHGFCRDEFNSQGTYVFYRNLTSDRLKLRSFCYHLCIATPGCMGFEIYNSNCEIHTGLIEAKYVVPLENDTREPECYQMSKYNTFSYLTVL